MPEPRLRSSASTLRAKLGAKLEERLAPESPARRLRFRLVHEMLARIPDGHQLRVLDAGCGDGLLVLALAERHPSWRLFGVDLRDELLAGARARARARGLGNVRFEHADVTRSLPANRLDVVLAIECLEEIRDDWAALRAMAEALAPGGILVAHVPERSWRAILPGSPSTWRDQVRQGYSATEIVEALRREGLDIMCVRPTFRGVVVVAQEIADRLKRGPLVVRALAFPAFAAAVRLERRGLTWGRGNAVVAIARKPPRD
jgi:SAM-dependent methyltransferase